MIKFVSKNCNLTLKIENTQIKIDSIEINWETVGLRGKNVSFVSSSD